MVPPGEVTWLWPKPRKKHVKSFSLILASYLKMTQNKLRSKNSQSQNDLNNLGSSVLSRTKLLRMRHSGRLWGSRRKNKKWRNPAQRGFLHIKPSVAICGANILTVERRQNGSSTSLGQRITDTRTLSRMNLHLLCTDFKELYDHSTRSTWSSRLRQLNIWLRDASLRSTRHNQNTKAVSLYAH